MCYNKHIKSKDISFIHYEINVLGNTFQKG
uniref:Uncharacterized protein n=1 Tax=Siphoviridae sp. ct5jB2 TaxID=2825337 RepID=A0A8S5TTQ6_9CAUD|nr:MAG TPA: hypothetical protein [Siphoviridae sp. ct5jB2]